MGWQRTRRTRREFLKQASAAVAAPYFVTSTAMGAAGQSPPSERITTALIGSGSRGQQIMAGGDKVVAVCDVDAENRARSKATIDQKAVNPSSLGVPNAVNALGDFFHQRSSTSMRRSIELARFMTNSPCY